MHPLFLLSMFALCLIPDPEKEKGMNLVTINIYDDTYMSHISFNEKRFFSLVPLITKFIRFIFISDFEFPFGRNSYFVFMTSFYGSFIIKDSIPRNIGPIIYYFISRTSYRMGTTNKNITFWFTVSPNRFHMGIYLLSPIHFDILELCGLFISTKFSEWLIFNLNDSKPLTATSDYDLTSYTYILIVSDSVLRSWICLSNDKNEWNVGAKCEERNFWQFHCLFFIKQSENHLLACSAYQLIV